MRTIRDQRSAYRQGGRTHRWTIVAMMASLAASATARGADPDPIVPPPPAASDAPATAATHDSALDPWSGRTAQPIEPKAVEVDVSYGWQIVVADLVGLLAVGVVADIGAGGASLAPYLLASPVVHIAHGNPGRAGGSLGLHVGMPIAGVLVGAAAGGGRCQGDSCNNVAPLVLGVLGGMVAATVVDAAWLGHATTEVAPSQVALAPMISVGRSGGATVGLAATF